jgi:hypothetical protein
MADTKTSALTAITGTNTATGDKFLVLDVSDTTQGAGGTLKNITRAEMVNALDAAGMTVNADIGVTVQAYDAQLADIAGLTATDNGVVIGNGTNFVVESGATLKTSLGLTIGTDVQAYDADTLKADVADVLTAGFAATAYNAGTKSAGTYTPDEANGNYQYAVNGGAHTLAPPTNTCSLVIQYTNNGSAGAVTTSGFTKVSGSFTTTDADDFMCYITKLGTFSHLNIVALQ